MVGELMKSRLIVILVLSLFLLFVPAETVLANSPPPPNVLWFTFVYDIPDQVSVEHISLFACKDETCSVPQTIEKTEAGTGSQVWRHGFYCYESWCRLRLSPTWTIDDAILDQDTNSYYFKIVVGFSDKERSSNVIKGLPKGYGSTKYFIADVHENDLVLSVDENFSPPKNGLGTVGLVFSFFITLLAEPVFAGVFLITIYKMENRQALKLVLFVFLINIITYPSLWGFSWAISQLEWSRDQRFLGWLALFMSIIFWTILLFIMSRKGKSRYIWMVLSPIFMVLFCIMFWLISSYLLIAGFPLFDTFSLSYWNVIIVIEILAVLYEGILIYALGKKVLSLPKALMVSFVMNLASFLIGFPFSNLLG
jgi:hypothetical protein